MAENTVQYELIVSYKGNLDALLPDSFVAGDLLWYPIQGDPSTSIAPDVLVALGRKKGDRSSFKQWEEGGPPEVVFEIWSPGNRFAEKLRKVQLYQRYGVQEFYSYDPDTEELTALVRDRYGLQPVDVSAGYASPLLGVRFVWESGHLVLKTPDGQPFRTFAEILADAAAAQEQAREAQEQAREAQEQAREAALRAEAAEARAARMAARLRELGIDPEGAV